MYEYQYEKINRTRETKVSAYFLRRCHLIDNKNDFDYAYLEHIKSTNPAIRLISAVNAPLILGFLHQVFIQGNRDSIIDTDIISKLSDYLYTIQTAYGDAKYPRTQKQYLDDWATDGYLRKFFSG